MPPAECSSEAESIRYAETRCTILFSIYRFPAIFYPSSRNYVLYGMHSLDLQMLFHSRPTVAEAEVNVVDDVADRFSLFPGHTLREAGNRHLVQ
jgi:hypothetical protein